MNIRVNSVQCLFNPTKQVANMKVKMVRMLNDTEVRQRVDSEFVSASDLIVAGNNHRRSVGLSPKVIGSYFLQKEVEELIESIKSHEGIDKIKMTSRGRNGATWVHPVIAVDMALWLTPSLKYEVYSWLSDNLLTNRISSADSFKEMNKALDKRFEIKGKYTYYVNAANAIRNAVGVIDWEHASEDELKLRDKIQDRVVAACEMGTTGTFDNLLTSAIASVMKH